MIDFTIPSKLYLLTGSSNMRQLQERTELLIKASPVFNATETAAYLFCNSQKNLIRIFYWDGEWFMVLSYHVITGTLKWPSHEVKFQEISLAQLERLLRGDTLIPSVRAPKIKVK